MMFRFRSLIVAVCLSCCLFVLFGCQKKTGGEDTGPIPDNLAVSALQTHAQYIKAVNSGQHSAVDRIRDAQVYSRQLRIDGQGPFTILLHQAFGATQDVEQRLGQRPCAILLQIETTRFA